MSDIKTNVPYISQKLDVRKVASVKDSGLRETAGDHLFATQWECEYSERDFGVIVKAQNSLFRPSGDITIKFFGKKLEIPVQDKTKEFVLSEIFLALNPGKSTTMMSHEGEIYECVEVVRGDMEYINDVSGNYTTVRHAYGTGDLFFSVSPAEKGLPRGFYHQLKNLNEEELVLSKIITLADKELAMKDGQLLKYGFNRPPNSYQKK